MKIEFRYYFFLILAGIFAGVIGVFVKLIGDNVHFLTLMFYRMSFAVLLLIFIIPLLDKKWYKVTKHDLKGYLLVSIIMTITFTLFVVANLYAPVQNVVLITNIAPFIILILAYFLLNEKITKTKIITLCFAIVGIAILNPFNLGENAFGNYLALGQAVFYSFLIILMRKQNKEHALGAVLWLFIFSSLILLPSPFIFGFGNFEEVWIYIIGLGFLSTGLTYLFHNWGLEKVGAEISSIIIMLTMPLSGILVAYFVLGEDINLRILIGGVILIFAGIYLQAHEKKLKSSIRNLSKVMFK